jgi:hypothetical protein
MVTASSAGPGVTRGQSAPGADKEYTQRTQGEEILHEIKKLKDTYGQKQEGAARPVPFSEIEKLYQKVEEITRQARVYDAYKRVEEAAKVIEKVVGKLEDRWKENNAQQSYAQAARMGSTGATQGTTPERPPAAHPRDGKRILIKINSKTEAETIKEQSREDIINRIQRATDEAQGKHTVIAVQKLRSGDLAIHMDSTTAKRDLEAETSWVQAITPGAKLRKQTWPVLIHGVKVADFQLNAWEEHAKRIQNDNAITHPNIKVIKMRWLGRTEGREYAPLVIEVGSAEQANRLINEGLAISYDLKIVERHDQRCRITQCFKCQRYGHISTQCRNQQKCGHCGGEHTTDECAAETQASQRSCAACTGGDHPSWSTACPSRIQEASRAKTARIIMMRLYPVPAKATPPPGDTPTDSIRFTGATQANDEWTTVTTKKRKYAAPGRPIGSLNRLKAIPRDADNHILNFSSQSSIRKEYETPTSTQLTAESEREIESTQTNQ